MDKRFMKRIYCISDWYQYALIEATSPLAALRKHFGVDYVCLDNSKLTANTVVSAMCCEYKHYAETCLEALSCDVDRVLWMDQYEYTLRFQSISSKN
ncbi:hypothetical protein B6A42_08720 [Vibrio coralliilyticus]|nr:hypothetical protein B6A42_08720 [Vibrio coralliilyticus]